jgi:Fur family transcriptional regulator, ferric uptake regulator
MTDSNNTLQCFSALLAKKKLKLTRERREIYAEVSRLKGHFDSDGLYQLLSKQKSGIARGTVYRTIPLLLESGVIQKSVGEGKKEFFERKSVKGHHDHLVCIGCRKIVEFHCEEVEKLQDKICEKYGYEIAFHDHRIFGYCRDCR